MNENLSNQIQIFKSIFKCREEVVAVRWEKENKSGYMPAYFYDPYMYRAHKINGGTLPNTFHHQIYLTPNGFHFNQSEFATRTTSLKPMTKAPAVGESSPTAAIGNAIML